MALSRSLCEAIPTASGLPLPGDLHTLDDPNYHLTCDLIEKALAWLDDCRAFDPNKPFVMYWAPASVHG